ncbi:LCP family protein [Egicoccus halophilus]|uniref:LCP family protein n=1 Tax=Egicoccus halophilus TaxID=1670830 RepID=UPI00102F4162|nr:LCP family protein [Egicoccus halophilus]
MPQTTTGRGDRTPGWGRRALWVVLGVLLLVAIGATVAIWSLDASIDRVGVDGLGESPPVGTGGDDATGVGDGEGTDASALTVLVLGSDSREVLTPEERVELGTGNAWGERTEVISLVRLAPEDEEIRMLSVPRDTLLERCDGTSGRINAAYTIGELDGRGGSTCVVETLSAWLDVRIDHVVKVDFRGFVDIVDALGGVSMYLEEPLQDDNANLDLRAGCVRLDGADALAFVRARHIDDDFGRMGRQQRFVTELRNELAAVGVFDDPARTYRVAEAVARSLELDDTLTLNRIQQLAREHRTTLQGGLEGQVVPGDIEVISEAAYVVVDEQRAHELVQWLLTGVDPAEPSSPAAGGGGSPIGDDTSGASDDGGDDVTAGAAQGLGTDSDEPAAPSPVERSAGCR